MDVSDFFARHHFPKLRYLYLFNNFRISCWDHLNSHTTALTELFLDQNNTTPLSAVPTTSQILSLLASNPNIRSLTLQWLTVSDDSGNDSTSLVPLCHLKRLCLVGEFREVFPIVHRLELPQRIDNARIEFHECEFEEADEIIGPYIQDYLRRDPRFKDRLEISASSGSHSTSINASVVEVEHHGPNPPQDDTPRATFEIELSDHVPTDVGEGLGIRVLALLPPESVVSFKTNLMTEEEAIVVPNLKTLHLVNPIVSSGFLLLDPGGPNAGRKLLPHLEWLELESPDLGLDDWDPVITYLTHQTSDGQSVSLKAFGEVHMCPEVVEEIEDLVEELTYTPSTEPSCFSGDCF